MYFVFQSSIIFAVCASNIHWQWTPNGYLASMLGGIAAILATVRLRQARVGTGQPVKRIHAATARRLGPIVVSLRTASPFTLTFSEPDGSPIPRRSAINFNRKINYPATGIV